MRLDRLIIFFAAAFAAFALAQPARATVMIIIDKGAQKMTVTVDGEDLAGVYRAIGIRHSVWRLPAVPHGERPLLAGVG